MARAISNSPTTRKRTIHRRFHLTVVTSSLAPDAGGSPSSGAWILAAPILSQCPKLSRHHVFRQAQRHHEPLVSTSRRRSAQTVNQLHCERCLGTRVVARWKATTPGAYHNHHGCSADSRFQMREYYAI